MKATASAPPTRLALGVYSDRDVIFMFFKEARSPTKIVVEASSDGQTFGHLAGEIIVRDKKNRHLSSDSWNHIQISRWDEHYTLLGLTTKNKVATSFIAQGRDLNWLSVLTPGPKPNTYPLIVDNFKYQNNYVQVSGGSSLALSSSSDLNAWQTIGTLVAQEKDFFGDKHIIPGNVFIDAPYITIAYFVTDEKSAHTHFVLKSLCVDINAPTTVTKKPETVWESPEEWLSKKVTPLGVIRLNKQFVSYWQVNDDVWSIKHPWLTAEIFQEKFPELFLARDKTNPIIAPISQNLWESRAVFNPAALTDENGDVHLLYRALGHDDISTLGYAKSSDGFNFDSRSSQPIFTVPDQSGIQAKFLGLPKTNYASGGGTNGGCEDPRLVKIGNRVYMTYVSFNGWNSLRMALTSISWDDFLHQKWHWDTPVYLSRPGEIHKNWVLFPQKINGKFALIHSISPHLCIEYFDSIKDFTKQKFIHSHYSKSGRRGHWDNWVRGAGPPPIKTDYGWLLLYHAMDSRDPNRYKLGAMLLDAKDPQRIISRSKRPILEPNEHYENAGHKAGVIYSCGAVVKNNQLIVYYGGADTVVCAASTNLDEFMIRLTKHRYEELTPTRILYQ